MSAQVMAQTHGTVNNIKINNNNETRSVFNRTGATEGAQSALGIGVVKSKKWELRNSNVLNPINHYPTQYENLKAGTLVGLKEQRRQKEQAKRNLNLTGFLKNARVNSSPG